MIMRPVWTIEIFEDSNKDHLVGFQFKGILVKPTKDVYFLYYQLGTAIDQIHRWHEGNG